MIDLLQVADIQRAVAQRYNLRREDMMGICHKAHLARPRMVAMFLARELTSRSLPDIGRRFGGRDHTTVIHAVRTVKARLEQSETLRESVGLIRAELDELANHRGVVAAWGNYDG